VESNVRIYERKGFQGDLDLRCAGTPFAGLGDVQDVWYRLNFGVNQERHYSVSRTAFRTLSTEGLKIRNFLATTRPSNKIVNSPRFPSTSSTSTPDSFRSASATRAACSLVPAHTGHSRIVTFFIAHSPSLLAGTGSPRGYACRWRAALRPLVTCISANRQAATSF
jgi:hypothetical protein